MSRLIEFIKKNRLFLDGAIGSRVMEEGYPSDKIEMLNLENPSLISKIHKEYLESGARLIYTNTFSANLIKYEQKTLERLTIAGVCLARKEAERFNGFVGYSIGSLGILTYPYKKESIEGYKMAFEHQAKLISKLNIDAVVIETMTDLLELKTAILAFKKYTNFPIFCSMTFNENGRTFSGTSLEAFALTAESLNVDAIGINCSFGADKMYELAKRLTKLCNKPIFIKPNAGLPIYNGGKAVYDTTAKEFAEHISKIALLGIPMLGGCCGTNAEYIAKTVEVCKDIPIKTFVNAQDYICGYSQVVNMSKRIVIGERINPTGNPLLKKAILDNDLGYIAGLATEQIEMGADAIDVNVGMTGIDEKEKLSQIVLSLQNVIAAPLVIDTSVTTALEEALSLTAGIPIVNSVNASEESLSKILPLVRKYGAYVIGLCLDEKGIPSTESHRFALARKIVYRARGMGVSSDKILIDPLTLTVATDTKAPITTLYTMTIIKSELNVKCVLGLSNVSFGLPNRQIINSTFYKMAIERGVNATIINPSLKPKEYKLARILLEGRDENCKGYLKDYSDEIVVSDIIEQDTVDIEQCILKGLSQKAVSVIAKAVTKDNFKSIIDNQIVTALNRLGTLYQEGRVFLPSLMIGADCAKIMLDYINANYLEGNIAKGEKIILLTVKGDVHDIGKNIVKAVLSNYGYEIIDLGRDVEPERVLNVLEQTKARIVGLSALMTTTLESMAITVRMIKEKYPKTKILIGGAVVTNEFKEQIGADFYCKNVQDAISCLYKLK